jgi:protein-disulfide isomerase
MNENNNNSNITQIALVGLLVVAAFFIGILSSRVKNLEKNNVAQVPQEETQIAGEPAENLSFDQIVSELGLDVEAFSECLLNGDTSQRVKDESASGVKAGVNGTPGNILLDTQTGMAVDIAGALPLNMLEDSLDDLKAGNGTDIDVDPVTEEDYLLGDRNSRYILFEYSDYDCPFCSSFHATAKEFTEANADVAWVYRQFPLDQLHPNARAKSEAALCAGEVGGNDAFWAFSDAMFGL